MERVIRVVAAVVEREGKYLITQRRDEAVLGGLWEFPGGKVEPGESDEHALGRELLERLGVAAEVKAKLTEHDHLYEGYRVHLTLYACELPEGAEPHAENVKDLRWVASSEFASYPFPPADQRSMDLLLGLRRN